MLVSVYSEIKGFTSSTLKSLYCCHVEENTSIPAVGAVGSSAYGALCRRGTCRSQQPANPATDR